MISNPALAYPARLAALARTGLVGAAPSDRFNRTTRFAASVFKVRMAAITLVEEDRVFFLSQFGIPEPWAYQRYAPLSHTFCKYIVGTAAPVQISDTRQRLLPSDNPALSEMGIFAYAGMPIFSPDGQVVGTIFVVDHRPHKWTSSDMDQLADIAAMVTSEFDLRTLEHQKAEEVAAENEALTLRTSLLESCAEGICGLDRNGACTYINAAGAKLLGYSPEELLGKRMRILIHYSGLDEIPIPEPEWPVTRMFERGEERRISDARFWRSDRSHFPAEYFFSPIMEGDGDDRKVIGAVITFTDASRSHQALAAERAMHAEYRDLVQDCVRGIYRVTIDGKFVSGNLALARTYGYESFEDLAANITNTAEQLYVDQSRAEAFTARINPSGVVYSFESQVYRKDRGVIWISESAHCVNDEFGAPQFYDGIVEDISERRRVQENQRRHAEFLVKLYDTGLALAGRYRPADIFEHSLLRTAHLLGAAHGFISTKDEETGILEMRSGIGAFARYTGYHHPTGIGVAGKVLETGQTLASNNYQNWSMRDTNLIAPTVRSILGAPLIVKGEIVGVISVGYDFSAVETRHDEMMVLSRLAQMISVTIDNANQIIAERRSFGRRRSDQPTNAQFSTPAEAPIEMRVAPSEDGATPQSGIDAASESSLGDSRHSDNVSSGA